MNLLFLGQPYENAGALPYQTAYLSECRDVHLPAETAKKGHSCWITTEGKGARHAYLPTGVQQIPLDRLPALSRFDALILLDLSGGLQLERHPILKEQALAHPHLIPILDGAYASQVPYCSTAWAIGATTAPLAAHFQTLYPNAIPFLSTYGFEDHTADPIPDDPYPPGHKPVLLFVGRMTPFHFRPLVRLSLDPRFEVWIAALFQNGSVPGHTPECGDALSDSEREAYFPNTHFISDLIPWQGGGGKHGPVLRSALPPFFFHAAMGLNFSDAARIELYAKLYDYLAYGLPTVTECHAPNASDVLALQAGQVFSFDEWQGAIWSEFGTLRDRDAIRRSAQLLGGWPVIAQRLQAVLERA
jgi:hypothetical protein